jgi:hypothetical protein
MTGHPTAAAILRQPHLIEHFEDDGVFYTARTPLRAAPNTQTRCAACGRIDCDHPDLIFAGLQPLRKER